MKKFVIEGKKKLEGTVLISGSKNGACAIIAATLLTKEPVILENLPQIEDIKKMIEILESMGAETEWLGENKIRIKNEKIDPEKMNYSLVGQMRASVLLIGPLLARFSKFKIPSPGGDKIGLRPIVTHLEALKKMGVEVSRNGSFYQFSAKSINGNQEIILSEFSVTATEDLMMLAAKTEGKTIIKIAAAEPHVKGLGTFLNSMGVKIRGAGTHTVEVEGKKELKGVTTYKIIPDYLEAGTFFIAGALTQGILEIKNIISEHLDSFLVKMEEIGVLFERGEDFLKVDFSPNLKPVKIQALPFPGFPTDLLPISVPLLTQALGRSLIHDPLYENRMNFIHELRKMGADIEIVDPHRAFVFGKTELSGIDILGWDIRAGASLLLAGLAAEGKTTIRNIYQIDRGYEKIDKKLRELGADIKRVED